MGLALLSTSTEVRAGGGPPEFVLEWGSQGPGNGQFQQMHGIEVAADGTVYVVDTLNNRIQVFTDEGALFTNDGVFITSWGSAGMGKGQFNFPRGLSTDDMDNVYVADRNLHRIQKFTNTGDFIAMWGSLGNGDVP